VTKAAASPATPSPQVEAAKFEGTWVLLRTRRNGELQKPADRVLLTFHGDHYTVTADGVLRQSGTWRLDASKTPKFLDRLGVNAKRASFTSLGIYEWTADDNLRICASRTQRPSEFGAPPGSDSFIQVFGRVKP
jgi:uncharacterized protein (TIGR03067 family)